MPFILKPYTLAQLAKLYNVSPKVMRRWLQSMQPQLGERRGGYYTMNQVLHNIQKLGVPGMCPADALEN